jgi:hypothetical protein
MRQSPPRLCGGEEPPSVRLRRSLVAVLAACLFVVCPGAVRAQQRPLVTEDPETVGSGLILIEGGFDIQNSILFPVSGLEGDLLRFPLLGVSIGVGPFAELQVDGGFYQRMNIKARHPAPLSSHLDFTGDRTSDVEDAVMAMKIRLVPEGAKRPAVGLRFATRLPNAGNESGLGIDTLEFHGTALIGKTVQSMRVVGNIGLAIMGDPTRGDQQGDLLTYGLSFARALRQGVEVVAEVNGRYAATYDEDTPPGGESRATVRLGGRFTTGTVRIDGAVLLGTTPRDPGFGFAAGVTWVFRAFTLP